MATRLKKKFKSYLTNIWLFEVAILVSICIYFGVEIYKDTFTRYYSKNLAAIEATINPKGHFKDTFESEIKTLQAYIYEKTDGLNVQFKVNDPKGSILKEYFIDNPVQTKESLGTTNKLYFIIRDKRTNAIITNDSSSELKNENVEFNEEYITEYIYSKYKGREMVSVYHNDNELKESTLYNYDNLKYFDEYYYTTTSRYLTPYNIRLAVYMGIIIGIGIFIFAKTVMVLILNKGRVELRGNFIRSIIFVLKYGFSYKQTRKTLMVSFIGLSLFFITYLYLLAVNGGYENNILSVFFLRYPFKGAFFLMILPMIGITYSLKKSIEIIKVNENLDKVNKEDLNYKIEVQGGPEVIELINNILEIRRGYEAAVEDALKNEKLKTELISNVSHDLRTPLTSIINYVNILKQDITEEERKEYLEIVENKSKKLKLLIDDLFEMSKINSGKMELCKEKINIVSLLHQIIGEYYYIYEGKNIEFKVDSFKDEIDVELDGKLISRAMENIIINAMKYSLEGTRVYVDIKEDGEFIVLSFKNISNYDMNFDNDEIFERFARGDVSRNSKVEGSGLGLAITKSIVELHDGKVSINREGDMFKIYISLPLGIKSI